MFSVSPVNGLTFKDKIALDCFLNLTFCASEIVSNSYLYIFLKLQMDPNNSNPNFLDYKLSLMF